MREKDRRLRLGRILILALILLLVLQLLMMGVYGCYGSMMMQERSEEAMRYIQNMYCANLEEALVETERNLRELLSERSGFRQLKSASSLQRWRITNRLLERLEECRDASGRTDAYAILGESSDLMISRSGNISYQDLTEVSAYLRAELDREEEDSRWRAAQLNGRGYLVKTYFCYGEVVLAALISEDRIRQILTYGQDLTRPDQTVDFFILDGSHRLICSSNSQQGSDEPETLPQQGADQSEQQEADRVAEALPQQRAGRPKQQGTDQAEALLEFGARWDEQGKSARYAYQERAILDGAYYVVCRMETPDLLGQSPLFVLILVLLLSSVLFLGWYLRFIRREVVAPIRDLFETSEKIQQGDLKVRPSYVCRSRELRELREAYGTMLDTILELKVREYEENLLLKDSELKYLHMQLKPHFFLNALSTINSMAYQGKTEEIRRFVQAFSENIRYMFRAGLYTVPLSEELDGVSKYLSMQRFLYGESFYAYFQVPDELRGYPVPQMLLHTFMENVFKHAAGQNAFLDIFVVCSADLHNGQEMLRIAIMDSGKRFPEEVVERINGENARPGDVERPGEDVQKRPDGQGIGLAHTKNILWIMYEQEGLLRLENEGEEGKRILVWIPRSVRKGLTGQHPTTKAACADLKETEDGG